MPTKSSLTIDQLWQIQRIGQPDIAPDGKAVVAAVSQFSMEDNSSESTLWLFPADGGARRPLTHCGDKDSQPRWSPRGDRIAFLAKREQEGSKDEVTQLYVMAADGGEARRAATLANGVEAFRWCPDGRRVVCVSWVRPDLRGDRAQTKARKEFDQRKESGYVSSEPLYRFWDHFLPMGRVPHLLLLDLDSGKSRDLFEGSDWELPRMDPDAIDFDVSPDGRRLVFTCDPLPEKRIENCMALAEMTLSNRAVHLLASDADWDFRSPRYSEDGERIAFTAQHVGVKHNMPTQLALLQRSVQGWSVVSDGWDHEVQAPLEWDAGGQALLFTAQHEGRQHLWRFALEERRAEVVATGGWVQSFTRAGDSLVTLVDTIDHPPQLRLRRAGETERRIDGLNEQLMGGIRLGRSEEVWVRGAGGDRVQLWLTYPPGFDRKGKKSAKKRWPILHLIHGGPHSAFGDSWHFRWNVQAFAAQGYVVVAVNYHGSSGFGYQFKDSITHRWGELELQDIEAATDHFLRQSWADKRRVFAAGGSYGGYMVAWMNGHVKPGRYAAYVCHAGCFDWTAMFADDAYSWHAKELGAWYWDDMERIHAQSPHAFAGEMYTPTLVVHGALDYRVPDAQGLAYYNTLKAREVDARLLWFPDENHWVVKPRNSRLWYTEFTAWLAQHDPYYCR